MPHRRLALAIGLLVAPFTLPAQGSVSTGVPLSELIKRAVSDSNDPAVHYNLALGYWGAKRWNDVEHELKEAVTLDPRFAEAHLAMAYLQIAANQKLINSTGDSKKDSIQVLADKFNHEYKLAFLLNPKVDIRIMASVSRASDERALQIVYGALFADYITGIQFCQEGNYPECESRLNNVINGRGGLAPDDAYWHRGLAAAQLKHYATAADDFKLLLDRDAERVKAAEEKGIIRVQIRSNEYRYFQAVFRDLNGESIVALDLYHAVLENDLGMYSAHIRLAEMFEAKRQYPDAVDERKRAIDANPDDPSLQFDLGVTLGKAGKTKDAEDALKLASDRMPRNIEAWFYLGLAYEKNGKTAEAKAAYQKVIALAPSRFKARADQAKARIAALQ